MFTPEATDTFAPRALSAAVAALDAITAGQGQHDLLTDDLLAGALALEWLARRGLNNAYAVEAVKGLRRMVCSPATAESIEASHLAEIVRDVLGRG